MFTRGEWSCGHVAGSVCGECYRMLAAKANELAAEVDALRIALDETKQLLHEARLRRSTTIRGRV